MTDHVEHRCGPPEPGRSSHPRTSAQGRRGPAAPNAQTPAMTDGTGLGRAEQAPPNTNPTQPIGARAQMTFTHHPRAVLTLCATLVLALALLTAAPAAPAAEACPNQALREQRGQAFMPDCRAWEMVSPPDKNGAQVTLGGGSFRGSSTGGSVYFDSNVASGDALGTGIVGVVTFRSDRTAGGWVAHSVMPVQDVNASALANGAVYQWLSPDLSRAILMAGSPALAPDAPQGVPNLYLVNTAGGSRQLLTPSVNPVVPGVWYSPVTVDVSDDGSRVIFESTQNLTADAPPRSAICNLTAGLFGCTTRLYEWHQGELRLVQILPDGSVAPQAAGGTAGEVAGQRGGPSLGFDGGDALSADGSRIYFSAPPSGPAALYLRKNGSETVLVSQSEATSPDPSPGPAFFSVASLDGTRAIFETSERLLDGDPDSARDLYMYTDSKKPSTESNLTLLSKDEDPVDGSRADVLGVLGAATDMSRVYFAAQGRIVPGQPTTGSGPKLYLWDHGVARYITTLLSPAPTADGSNWLREAKERTSRVTDDGRYVVFTTAAPQPGGFDNAGHQEVYRYDALTQDLACLSCGPGSGPAKFDASPLGPNPAGTRGYGYSARFLSADGSRVFFNTAEPLVPGDVNGKVDAYEWQAGSVHLLSSGRSTQDSYFVDASASGDDAYFATAESLSRWDGDSVLDLYDARMGGGLPEPPPAVAPCAGEACQGPLNAAPGESAPTGTLVAGVGNLATVTSPPTHRAVANAQRRANALRACRRRPRGQRKRCEARARRRHRISTARTSVNANSGAK